VDEERKGENALRTIVIVEINDSAEGPRPKECVIRNKNLSRKKEEPCAHEGKVGKEQF